MENEEQIISQAMTLLGRRKSARKADASRANGAQHVMTPQTREKLRVAQQARRERERAAKAQEE